MKAIILAISVSLITQWSLQIQAGPYTALKNNACPDAWAMNDKAIPVVRHEPREGDVSPWGVLPSTDYITAEGHMRNSGALDTTDPLAFSRVDLSLGLNQGAPLDLLTVASECLKQRNGAVDTWNYVPTPNAIPSLENGWIPAVVF